MGAAIFIISIPFFIFAIILSKGKGAALIAGYNTMSDSEKSQYDEAALCKFMAKIMYGIGFGILLLGLGTMLESRVLTIAAIILLITFVVFSMVYPNTKDRFKRS
ncbi:DUF3784 domain-containing protein [Peribacillus sp. SCS-26]|uniref:DUF3784 domain-containing protein n=1 Tax=Paraperibacillus marinus TaxID=3115295 RepID=UPI003906622A